MYKNSEGYSSPTEGMAISHVMKEYRQQQKKRYANKNRRKVYVASKYSGDVNANVTAAIGYCRRVIREGYMPIASHLLYQGLASGETVCAKLSVQPRHGDGRCNHQFRNS